MIKRLHVYGSAIQGKKKKKRQKKCSWVFPQTIAPGNNN